MDFEMDIPDADELQWLESNSLLPEDEEDYYTIVEEEEPPAAPSDLPDPRKRARPDPPVDLDASERIKRRELAAESCDAGVAPEAEVAPEVDAPVAGATLEVEEEEKFISRFAIEIEGDCMPVTGPGGDRVYAKLNKRVGNRSASAKLKSVSHKSSKGLLSAPISALINEVEQEILQKTLEQSFGSSSRNEHPSSPIATEQLWVDKYAPNSFTELLSDEQTNREVLLWLKQWDPIVFGSQIRSTTDDVLSALRRHSSVLHKNHADKSGYFSKNMKGSFSNQRQSLPNVTDKENDNLNNIFELRNKKQSTSLPLEQKVLLLCGPPGLGKTTLAHVAAKHCGYRVVEINASDERSTSAVESKILDVVQMDSVMSDSRPKCLVIDEIDGALSEGKGAVEVILKMVAAEKQFSGEKRITSSQDETGKASSRKGKKMVKLLRPVICICNDLYAPALRSLRQVAKVHTFVQPSASRVVNRLKYICKKEGFKTNSISLSALAEYTECDVRSCLNTLQFLHKKKETLNFIDVGSQVVGMKDISRSVFDIWKEVFQKRKSKRERKLEGGLGGQANFDFLYSLFSNRGDYELTMDGIHENFLRLAYHDPMMHKTVKCLDALGFSDSLFRYIWRNQQMSLNVYQPPIAITMRNMIAQFEKPHIEWPKSLQRSRTMLMERKDMLKIWHNKMLPSISRHISSEYFVEDLISPLLHILSPPSLRPVALHLLSEREKNDLAQLVDTMVSYAITYKYTKPESLQKVNIFLTVSDAPTLTIDPQIDIFVRFKDYKSEKHGLSLAVKQILLQEVEKQRILRESIGKGNDKVMPISSTRPANEAGSAQLKGALNKKLGRESSVSVPSKVNESSLANGVPSKMPNGKKPFRTSSSFFDSFRKGSNGQSASSGETFQKAATLKRDSRPFLFKHNEGFTNAVRKPMKVRDFFL